MTTEATLRRGARAGGGGPLELVLLYFVVPLSLCLARREVGRLLLPVLLGVGALGLLALLRDPAFDRGRLWRLRGLGATLRRTLVEVLVGGVALTALVAWFRPEALFAFARERTGLWLAVLVLYPLLSAYPQELFFRTLLFHRYRHLVRDERHLALVGALSFALAHVFLWNWIAPALSLLGGLLFARTYLRSGSTLQAALEHGVWGDVIFTVGLGLHFYGGAL